jgi:hypothetical protein
MLLTANFGHCDRRRGSMLKDIMTNFVTIKDRAQGMIVSMSQREFYSCMLCIETYPSDPILALIEKEIATLKVVRVPIVLDKSQTYLL